MTIQARKDPQTMTAAWEPVSVPLDGVKIIRTRNIVTRNGYTMEAFRADWSETGYDVRHVMVNRWELPIISDWHCHRKQSDHITVLQGRLLIGLYDNRPESPSFEQSMIVRSDWADPQTVVIPPQVFHSFKVLVAPVIMLNSITHEYDYGDPDHWRLTGAEKKKIPIDLAALE
jgi:dTDP-4-dehydrorhamnose 3,5-epimerase